MVASLQKADETAIRNLTIVASLQRHGSLLLIATFLSAADWAKPIWISNFKGCEMVMAYDCSYLLFSYAISSLCNQTSPIWAPAPYDLNYYILRYPTHIKNLPPTTKEICNYTWYPIEWLGLLPDWLWELVHVGLLELMPDGLFFCWNEAQMEDG